MSGPLILLVEDHPDNRVLARKLLERAGFRVVEAVDGRQALEQAAACKPDLILLDMSLPEVDGWTVARTLRKSPELQNLRIVALTAHAMEGDRERVLEAGCDEFLTKPIEIATFVPTVRRLLERQS
ncbi:MAG TPA: response regulator [Methylomirabilota bacterium]